MNERPTYVRQLAAELELLSHGATSSFGASSSGVPGSREPSGETKPPHEQMLADWDAHGDSVLERWNETLKAWKGSGKVRPAGVSEREIVLTDGEGFSADDVAMRYRLTATMVRKWRLEDGRNVATGKRVRTTGKTQQEIAAELGVSQPTVSRLKRAA